MNKSTYPDIPPRRSPLKKFINKTVLLVLGRALQSLSHSDPLMQHEIEAWPEDFTMMIVIRADGGSMAVTRDSKAQLVYRGAHFDPGQANVVITIKNIDSAFAMFTGQLGADVAYARHAMSAKGDLSYTVSVVRILNIAEAYLFPAFIARNIMKQLPPIPAARKQILRLKTYFLGVPFGI